MFPFVFLLCRLLLRYNAKCLYLQKGSVLHMLDYTHNMVVPRLPHLPLMVVKQGCQEKESGKEVACAFGRYCNDNHARVETVRGKTHQVESRYVYHFLQ